MTWKHWTAVAIVIGGGILLQIPEHDADTMADHPGHATDVAAPEAGEQQPAHLRTIALEVTGMT